MEDQKEHWAQTAKFGALASVIDPNDTKGLKNLYIAQLRDHVFVRNLPTREIELLDFGCGSGNLSKSLASESRRITGIDISAELLNLAIQQNDSSFCKFVLYDGAEIPFESQSFDYVATYVVLNHIVDDGQLTETLRNVSRVLKDDGRALFIEQTRRKEKTTADGIKKQRSVADFTNIFDHAGFTVERIEHLRKARFLPIYLIRYGLIPKGFFPFIARLDRCFTRLFSSPITSYVDTLFVLKKHGIEGG